VHALSSLNLKISAGEFYLLRGANGSGKTTLINVLAGRAQADSGSCLVRGVEIRATTDLPRNFSVATVFQSMQAGIVPGLSVSDHFILRRALSNRDRMPRSQIRGMARSFVETRPLLRTLLDRFDDPGTGLSGGWQQALQIAAAVFAEPDILLLDEPTSNLSPENRAVLDELVAADCSSKIVIYSTHLELGAGLKSKVTKILQMEGGAIRHVDNP
jgi:ABC-type multidrug transport system ATPase subunit